MKLFRASARIGAMAVWLGALLSVCTPGVVRASSKVFGVQKFSVQTTIPREVPENPEKLSKEQETGFRVVNEPYSFTQAGGHPVALTTTVVFNSELFSPLGKPSQSNEVPVQDPKDVVVNIPPGLIGDPQAVPQCSLTNVTSKEKIRCPGDTQVGSIRIRFAGGEKEALGPIYNVTPEAGQSAEFALVTREVNFLATAHLVRGPNGYGITVVSNEIAGVELVESEVTFWGVPAEARYDSMRGLSCITPASKEIALCHHNGVFTTLGGEKSGIVPVPFLSMPTNCTAGAESAVIRADSWENPGHYVAGPPAVMPPVTGCNLLKFEPAVEARPDTLLADAPVALGVNVTVPQSAQPGVLATAHLRNATVTLPPGVSVSPGIVDGIRACEATGPEGIDMPTGLNAAGGPLQPGELGEGEQRGLNGEPQLAPGHCPAESTIGETEAETPLLASPVKGHVYLARPGCGGAGQAPCTDEDALDGNLYKMYLEFGGFGALGDAGVNVKVEGRVEANPATGQLTAIVDENPQAPIGNVRIRLNGGPRAGLDNPAACGRATTFADFTPWSAPGQTPEGPFAAGTPDATPSSSYEVVGCQTPRPLAPGFVAGTVSPLAGRFSAFTMDLSRNDREQYVKGIQVHTPPGLLAMIASVPLCGEAQADAGACPESSRIGTTRVASGAGSHPFEIGGDIYLTGPYRGAPFGLSIVTHVEAGPFDLGLVVVRARIDIDPNDSTARITTDETGPYALPQIVFGVPVRLKRVTVDVDRPGFMFNPTNCAAQRVSAQVAGAEGALSEVSSPFAAGDCRSLQFKPKFTVATNAKLGPKRAASLDVKLSYPTDALGNDANVARVKVSLPKQMPSRLATLQHACTAATFERDPAACPRGSIVGIARAKTPLLPVGLEGPAYFVSHGGQAFPSLIIVLQGDNVRVDLTGETFINERTSITSSTFKTVPDVPVGTFELYLPATGEGSALAATASPCKAAAKLKMPTEFVAQNGAVLKQTTRIVVNGCKQSKHRVKAKKSSRRARGARRDTIGTAGRGR